MRACSGTVCVQFPRTIVPSVDSDLEVTLLSSTKHTLRAALANLAIMQNLPGLRQLPEGCTAISAV